MNMSDWKNAEAPNLAVIETLAALAWERLPAHFRQMCGDLVIRVVDFAPDDVLDELEIEDAFDLMGLYQGVSLDKKSAQDQPNEPDMVFIFRRPILDYWSDGEESLGDIVAHVLIHEIGHHFGFSDEDMEAIEEETAA
jgi:predicted Zn-dependent protease with MMP-like domain